MPKVNKGGYTVELSQTEWQTIKDYYYGSETSDTALENRVADMVDSVDGETK